MAKQRIADQMDMLSAPTSGQARPSRNGRATAQSMAANQREISVSEFFSRNRHLLGFDNPRRALLTGVKEAVDNSLDACEEAIKWLEAGAGPWTRSNASYCDIIVSKMDQ